MTFYEYQTEAMTTCMESSNNAAYMFLNFLGEAGELTEKVAETITDKAEKKLLLKIVKMLKQQGARAKYLRKNPDTLEADNLRHVYNRLRYADDEQRKGLIHELGDVEWQRSGFMYVLGIDPELTAIANLQMLADRQQRGQIDGDGDNR